MNRHNCSGICSVGMYPLTYKRSTQRVDSEM